MKILMNRYFFLLLNMKVCTAHKYATSENLDLREYQTEPDYTSGLNDEDFDAGSEFR